MTVILEGLALAGYRSFGDEIVRIGPFGKVNFLIGTNNSGKSNILRFISRHLKQILADEDTNLESTVDSHRGLSPRPARTLGNLG